MVNTLWLFNIDMERSTIFENGKPSISMGYLYHGYVSHNQRVVKFNGILWGDNGHSWNLTGFWWIVISWDIYEQPYATLI